MPTAQNADDWAIVVGIGNYPDPDFGNLDGSVNDAEAFYDWLVEDAGVPIGQIAKITSNGIAIMSRSEATPTVLEVFKAFSKIKEKGENGNLFSGRRLYIYLSGHGCSPQRNNEEENTVLFMANASKTDTGPMFHWVGENTANWFYYAAYFDEVLLFMDCCRLPNELPMLHLPWVRRTNFDFVNKKRFFARATQWGLLTRNRPADTTGKVYGAFTSALLDGLRGKAADQNGQITTKTLREWLEQNTKEYMSPEARADVQTGLTPVIRPDDTFVIAKVSPPEFKVQIHLPGNLVGHRAVIQPAGLGKEIVVDSAPVLLEHSLPKGLYKVLIGDLSGKFKVLQPGGVNVEFG
jgi:Caspase domain